MIGEILGRQVKFTQCKGEGTRASVRVRETERKKGNIAITSITRNSMKHVSELLRLMASHFFIPGKF